MLFKGVKLEVVGAVPQSVLVHTARNEASSRQGIATHSELQYISVMPT